MTGLRVLATKTCLPYLILKKFFLLSQKTCYNLLNFLSLIDKYFVPHHNLHKLFNQSNVKISYSCLPNIKSVINKHNRKIYTRKQLLVEELATSSFCLNIPETGVPVIIFYTEKTLPNQSRTRRPKFTMLFVKQN